MSISTFPQQLRLRLLLAGTGLIGGLLICGQSYGLVTPDPEELENSLFINQTESLESYSREKSEFQKEESLIITQVNNVDSIAVTRVEVVGSTIFTAAEFEPIVQPLEGTSVTEQQLTDTVNAITQLYLNGGYLNSRAILLGIQDGIVTIQVMEGTIENVIVEGTDRLQNYVRSRIGLGIGTPLNVRKLEEQLRLLQNDPLFENIEATLRPPTIETEATQNQSILVVKVTEANPFIGSVGIDNYSPPSIGPTRFNLNLGYRNLTGIGDEFFASYRPRLESWDGTYQLELSYRAPLNPMDGALRFSTSIERNKVINGPPAGISNLGISGKSERYTLEYRQPLIRTLEQEFALSVGFSYYNGRTFIFNDVPTPFGFGPNDQGVTITSVFTFGQDYVFRDTSGAWGLRSQFRFGTGLFDATSNPSPIPDGQFFSWLGQFQRVQVINPNNLLIAQLDIQLTPNSLLPSEQFVIGGGQSVRGYRQNVMAGDNGIRFSLEDRITLVRDQSENPIFTLAPFFDLGAVWNKGNNPNTILANQTVIAGLGLGFIWQPLEKMYIRLDYAPPLMNLNTRGQNVQDDGFYFNINYSF